MAYLALGSHYRAVNYFGQTVAALDGTWHRERFGPVFLPAVESRTMLAICHAELGAFAEGKALGEEGLRIAEAGDCTRRRRISRALCKRDVQKKPCVPSFPEQLLTGGGVKHIMRSPHTTQDAWRRIHGT
jgi:hypothetical protein